ncbi:MAG: hypothetical protein ABEH43_02870 [Flavobacteriales bacterium]
MDEDNQERFYRRQIPKKQLYILTESAFFNAFRDFEVFFRDIFLLYCKETKARNGKRPKSFLNPKSFEHAEELIQSSMQFLDWSSPDKLINRSKLYLQNDGYPLKDLISSNQNRLNNYKNLRNHIAHNSKESYRKYKNILHSYYGYTPLNPEPPGSYLLNPSNENSGNYILLDFFDDLESISYNMTEI